MEKTDDTMYARQMFTFVQALGVVMGRLAGTRKRRLELVEAVKLQARIGTAQYGPNSGKLAELFAFMLSIPAEGEAADAAWQQRLRELIAGEPDASAPDPTGPEILDLLSRAAGDPTPPAKPRTPRKPSRSDDR